MFQVLRKNVPGICGPNGSFNPHLRLVSNFFRPDDTLTIVGMFNMVSSSSSSINRSGRDLSVLLFEIGKNKTCAPRPFFYLYYCVAIIIALLYSSYYVNLSNLLFSRLVTCRFPLSMILTRMGPLFHPFLKLVCVFFINVIVVVLLPPPQFFIYFSKLCG